MELLESHAIDTYGEFLTENADHLKSIAAPDIAVSYYTGGDLYQFDEFQVFKSLLYN
jgi:ubiquinol oxidase